MNNQNTPEKQVIARERREVLQQLEDWLETPMSVLSFAWLALFIIQAIWQLSPLLQVVSNVIWIIFIIDFTVKFTLAPGKLAYLRSNWLTAIALLLPALRVFRLASIIRVLRTVRAACGLQLVSVMTHTNRGMRALGDKLRSSRFRLCHRADSANYPSGSGRDVCI